MKQCILFFLLWVVGYAVVKAQALAPAGTKLHYAMLTNNVDFTYQTYLPFTFDTATIAGKQYSIIRATSLDYSDTEYVVRMDSNQLYWFRKGREYRMFDFNAKANDSIDIYCYYYQGSSRYKDTFEWVRAHIDSIIPDTFIVSGAVSMLKKYYFSSQVSGTNQYGNHHFRFWLYERVLNIRLSYVYSLLGMNFGAFPASDDHARLRCYEEPGQPIIRSSWWNKFIKDGPCDYVRKLSVEEIGAGPGIFVFPNPAKDKVTVQIPTTCSGINGVSVYNTFGQLIHRYKVFDEIIEMNIEICPDGVYLMKADFKDGTSGFTKLMVSHTSP